MIHDPIFYKLISLCSLMIWIALWRFFFKSAFSILLAIFIFAGGIFLIAIYPTVVFACDMCESTYIAQYVIVATIAFFILFLLGKFFISLFLKKRLNK